MSEPIYLLLGIHHHQPVGNFDDVFKMAFDRCYRPVLYAIERHPQIKFSIHHSGPLLDWATAREGDYLDKVTKLAKSGQLEILTGGYYEPILPILKPLDALGQIEMTQRFWEKRIGKKPAGMWLAERVWEPSLAALLNDAGILFTILDDQHFRHAGITDQTLFGFYRTERAGKAVSIFPSDKMMRYLIPFKQPDDVIGHLLYLQEKFPGRAITYGDDGEKFGVWPGTYEWVIEQGWLEKFLSGLEKHKDRIVTTTFSEYMSAHNPTGTVYLPTASYSEMLEWAMPARAIVTYENTRRALEHAGLWERAAPFCRGGFWDNFLTKYPESNLIHKRSLYISDKIDKAEAKGHDLAKARHALYRAQCNCAYWHGLFGGLYLNYLRHALYHNLIDADVLVDNAVFGNKPFMNAKVADIDCDGVEEINLSSEILSCIIKPNAGGSIIALDFRPKKFNLLNTLARRFEAYHEPKDSHEHGCGGDVPSIHELGKDLGELKKFLVYDKSPRYAFLDHAFENEPDWNSILETRYEDSFPMYLQNYQLKAVPHKEVGSILVCECKNSNGDILKVEKSYHLKKSTHIDVHYNYHFTGIFKPPQWLATEVNFTLLAGRSKDRYYIWNGIEPGACLMDTKQILENVHRIEAVDTVFGFKLSIEALAARMAILPVETVSQSEKGFDLIYQGSTIWLAWKPAWQENGKTQFSVGISVNNV